MTHNRLSRKRGNQKQQTILYPSHQEHPLGVIFLSVAEEASFVISQIRTLSHHRLDPHPGSFVSRHWTGTKYFQQIISLLYASV